VRYFVVFFVVAWIAVYSSLALDANGQEPSWEMYRPHAIRAWKTYREQLVCASVSGEGLYKYIVHSDRISGNALYTTVEGASRENRLIRHVIIETDHFAVIEKARTDTKFKLVEDLSFAVPGKRDDINKYHNRIARIMFPSLYVMARPIDELIEGGEAKILSVGTDKLNANLVTVDIEISENILYDRFDQLERPELVKLKVVFDAERLWIIKAYDITWLGGREFSVRNDTVAFLGCAVCSRSVSGSVFPESETASAVQIEETTQTYSIISPEEVRSKIAEARALVDQ
jgi:hypothetical protein